MNTAVHISKLYLEIILLILLLHGHKLCLQAGSEVVYSWFFVCYGHCSALDHQPQL